jgi:hypothetical protein
MILVITFSCLNVAKGSVGDPESIPWKDIHFCRFWQSEKGVLVEKVLILNEKNEPVTISLMIAHTEYGPEERMKIITDSSLGVVGGPWQISGNGYHIANMPRFDSIGRLGYYYKIICSTSDKTGLMHIYNAKPICMLSNDKIITSIGGDNIGNTHGECWWEQSSLFVKSGERVSAHFSFVPILFNPKLINECYIRVKDPTDTTTSGPAKPIKLIKVVSGNFPVESEIQAPDKPYKWKSLTVSFPSPIDSSELIRNYSVDFILEVPKVLSPEYHYFGSFIMRGGDGGIFFLPIIVLPK